MLASLQAGLSTRAADAVRVTDVRFATRGERFELVVRAAAPIEARIETTDARTVVLRLPGAVLPSSYPNFQSVVDRSVVSVATQQTGTSSSDALIALAVRAPVRASLTRDDGGRVVTLTLDPGTASVYATAAPETPAAANPPLVAAPVAAARDIVPLARASAPPPFADRRPARAAVSLSRLDAETALEALRPLFPRVRITRAGAHALGLQGNADDVAAARQVAAALDAEPQARTAADVIVPHGRPGELLAILRRVYPDARFTPGPERTIVVVAAPGELDAIRRFAGSLDAARPPAAETTETFRPQRTGAPALARALAGGVRDVRISVSGGSVIVSGPAESVARARSLATALDVSPAFASSAQIYKLHFSGAGAIAGVLRKAYPNVSIVEDVPTNSVVVRAPEGMQAQIAPIVAQLDAAPAAGGGGPVGTVVLPVRNAVPGGGSSGGSSTASDIAAALIAILQPSAPDLRVVVPAGTTLLALTGSPATLAAAQELLTKIDVPATQLALDTAVYEVDESAARNVGLQLPNPVLSTTFTEITPGSSAFATPAPLGAIAKFGRTPIAFQAQLNLLVSNGNARVLANPRVTTISGRVATIRAGDNIPYVQTVQNGIVGTVSQTVLTFQTGVTLDITPIANPDGVISVTLHPIVNTLTGVTAQGVPQISSREAQTTVNLRDQETVVIGGLIQESDVSTQTKIPLVGDLPLIGGLFRNRSATRSRNELIIVVTPHILIAAASPVPAASPQR